MNPENNQIQQQHITELQHHRKFLYAAVGFSFLAVVLLVLVLAAFMKQSSKSISQVEQPAPQKQIVVDQGSGKTAVTPVPVHTTQDVNNALQQVNSTDPSTIGGGLDQNNSDVSQFSQ